MPGSGTETPSGPTEPSHGIYDLLHQEGGKAVDKTLETVGQGWWKQADDSQKFAVAVLIAAAILGPLGQGVLGAIKVLYKPALPTSQQVAAVWWLAVLTLPVFAAAAALTFFGGRTAWATVSILVGLAAYLGGVGLASVGVPAKLGNVYCYNDGTVLQHECRTFDSYGFTSHTHDLVGSPSRAPEIVEWAFVYTADARGSLMAVCGIGAGLAAGYLFRRETAT